MYVCISSFLSPIHPLRSKHKKFCASSLYSFSFAVLFVCILSDVSLPFRCPLSSKTFEASWQLPRHSLSVALQPARFAKEFNFSCTYLFTYTFQAVQSFGCKKDGEGLERFVSEECCDNVPFVVLSLKLTFSPSVWGGG